MTTVYSEKKNLGVFPPVFALLLFLYEKSYTVLIGSWGDPLPFPLFSVFLGVILVEFELQNLALGATTDERHGNSTYLQPALLMSLPYPAGT